MAIAGISIIGIAASLLVPSTAQAANEYSLEVLAQKGSGCRPGTIEDPTYDEDGKMFNLVYDDFTVDGGQSKYCQLSLKVHVPAGISYAIYQLSNRGMGYLTGKAKAVQTVSAYFIGESQTVNEQKVFSAPLGSDGIKSPWQLDASWPGEDLWSPCGEARKMFVKNNLQVVGDSKNTMELQDTDLKVSTQFYFEFKPC